MTVGICCAARAAWIHYATLRIPAFGRLLASHGRLTVAREAQIVVVGWQVFALTRDPLTLGLIGLAEALAVHPRGTLRGTCRRPRRAPDDGRRRHVRAGRLGDRARDPDADAGREHRHAGAAGVRGDGHQRDGAQLHRARPELRDELRLSESLQAGIRFVVREPVLLRAMTPDLFAVLFGGAVALLPAFAQLLDSVAVTTWRARALRALREV